MKLIYTPAEGDRREWSLDVDDLDLGELMDVESVTGQTAQEFGSLLGRGSLTAMSAMLWVLRKRTEPGLTFLDMRAVKMSELDIEDDDEAVDPKDEADSAA